MDFNFTNPNEMSKTDFEEKKKFHNWEVYTEQQIAGYGVGVAKLIQKSLESELSSEEGEALKVARAEMKNLNPIIVTDMVEGRLIKSLFYVQEPQVSVTDTLEKSTDGKPVQKITFLDTPLNRELGRVGQEIIKGETKSTDPEEEMLKSIMDRDDFKKACEYMEKGMKDEEMMDEMKKSFPEVSADDMKKFKKGFAKKQYDSLMEKAMTMKKNMAGEDLDQ